MSNICKWVTDIDGAKYVVPGKPIEEGNRIAIILLLNKNGKEVFEYTDGYVFKKFHAPRYELWVRSENKTQSKDKTCHFIDATFDYNTVMCNTLTMEAENIVLLCAPFVVTDEEAESYMYLVKQWNRNGVSKSDKLFGTIVDSKSFLPTSTFVTKFSLVHEKRNPVVQAHWARIAGHPACSNCNTALATKWYFCPTCGARMDEEV